MADNTGTALTTVPEESAAIVERKATVMLPIAAPAELIKAQNAMRALIKEALQEGDEPGTGDYGVFPGTKKKALYKPGAEKIALGMGCYYGPPRIVEREVNHNHANEYSYRKVTEWKTVNGQRKPAKVEEMVGTSQGLYRYVIAVDVINRATGDVIGQGIGSCSSMESKYISRPRDCENTVVKMAHKRAIVGAALISFGLSGEFNSGEDDEEEEREPGDESESDKPKAARAKATTGGAPKCPKCKGPMWDNRLNKTNPRQPDFRCKDKEKCDGVIWPPKEAQPSQDELARLEADDDELPFD